MSISTIRSAKLTGAKVNASANAPSKRAAPTMAQKRERAAKAARTRAETAQTALNALLVALKVVLSFNVKRSRAPGAAA